MIVGRVEEIVSVLPCLLYGLEIALVHCLPSLYEEPKAYRAARMYVSVDILIHAHLFTDRVICESPRTKTVGVPQPLSDPEHAS